MGEIEYVMEDRITYRWECVYCGFEHNHSKRPTKCSCRNGYVKHIKRDVIQAKGVSE